VDLRVEVFVDARADLIFNFGAPYRREVIGRSATEIAASNFDAQRLVPIRIEQHGRVRVSGVRFHLGGVGPFTSTPLAPSSGSALPPAMLFGPGTERLEGELRDERDPDAAAALLDAFFLERLARGGPNRTFVRALDALRASDGQAASAELAEGAEVSRRHLERLFARELGFPPKTVGRVMRFQRALKSLMTTPDEPLSALASATGYFDQAHFIRDFKQFTGGIPRGYRGYYPPAGPTDFAPNVVVFVQDASGILDQD
jgi:AraC-like DNA-binding protein